MSSSSRTRVLRGVSFERAFSPLEAELPGPAVGVDPLVAAAEERRGYDDGYQAGMAEGLAAGRAAAAAEAAATVARRAHPHPRPGRGTRRLHPRSGRLPHRRPARPGPGPGPLRPARRGTVSPVRVIEPRRLAAALEAARPRRFGRVERVVGIHLEV